jgi:ABC-type transport system substrate-binding protein
MTRNRLTTFVLAAAMVAGVAVLGGCHTAWQCPILQGASGYSIVPPLPPEGEGYKVVGYRDGIRFYVLQFDSKVYRGGDMTSEAGAQALKQLGIKTIISTNPSDSERQLCRKYGFHLVEVPFSWGAHDMSAADLDRGLAAIDAGPAPVYVKDKIGTIEAGVLVAHYRIHRCHYTYDQAVREFDRSDGPDIPSQGNYWDALDMLAKVKAAAAEKK